MSLFQGEFHVKYRGIPFDSKWIYDRLLPRLHTMIKTEIMMDQVIEKLKEIKAENPKDERIVKVDDIWYEDYVPTLINSMFIEIAGPITPRAPFSSCHPQIYCNEDLCYTWDLDDCYKFIISKFTRVEEYEEKMNEEVSDDDSWMSWGPDPLTYFQYFIIDSFLIKVKYRDYLNGYMHGDDLWVSVLFEVPRSLDALLYDPISKRPPRDWYVLSNRVDALLL